MRNLILLSIVAASIAMSSCSNKKEDMKALAESNIKTSLQDQEGYKLIGMAEPDSCFGTRYMSQKEITGIINTMQAVTNKIMHETNNFTGVDETSEKCMKLAERQMQAAATVNAILNGSSRVKGKWTGWKIKADYEARDIQGTTYRAERWFFINKEGTKITRTFEIPIP